MYDRILLVMNDEMNQYKTLYFQTAKEHINTLSENLPKFVQGNENDKEMAEKIFIAAHSLKGQSLMMGYQKVGHACLLIEKTFRNIKDGVFNKDQVNADLAQQIVDKVSQWVNTAEAESMEPDLDQEVAELEKPIA